MTSVKRLWNTLFGKPAADKKKGKKDKEATPVYPESSSILDNTRRPAEPLPGSWISEPDEDSKPLYTLNMSMVDSSHSNVSQGGEVTQQLFSRATQTTSASVQVPARFHTANQSWASHRSSNTPVGPATPPLGGSNETIRANRSPKDSRHGSAPDNAAAAIESLNLSELLHAEYETLDSMHTDGTVPGQHSGRSTHSEVPPGTIPSSTHTPPFPLKARSNRVCAITEEASDAAVAGTSGSHSIGASGHHMLTADRAVAALAPSTPGSSKATPTVLTPSSTPAVAPSTPDQPPGQTHKLRYVELWLADAEGGGCRGSSPRQADSAGASTSEPEGRANGHLVREGLRAGSGSRNLLSGPAAQQPTASTTRRDMSPAPPSRPGLPPEHRPPATAPAAPQQQPQPHQHQQQQHSHPWRSGSKSAWLQDESAEAGMPGRTPPNDPPPASAGPTPTPPPAPMQPAPSPSMQAAAAQRAPSPSLPAEDTRPAELSGQLEEQPVATTSDRAAASTPADGRRGSKPGSVKTITVAKHCPKDIIASSWSIHDYDILKKCYEGHLSVVCQVRHKASGRQLAMKIYKRSRLHEMERYQLAREICMHVRITHPHIIKLFAAWKDPSYVYLAMELAPRGNLFDYLVSRGGKLPEAEAARTVMQPLLSALVYIHNLNFIHRDIKLENILLSDELGMKLADFGLAIDHNYEVANTRLGTFGYFAPEVLDCPLKQSPFDYKDQTQLGYNSKVDIWSLGVLCFELLTGKGPFSAPTAQKIIQAIRSRVVQYPESLSPEARDFMDLALQRSPDKRATAKQLLTHPWITQHCPAAAAPPPGQTSAPSVESPREEGMDVPGVVL